MNHPYRKSREDLAGMVRELDRGYDRLVREDRIKSYDSLGSQLQSQGDVDQLIISLGMELYRQGNTEVSNIVGKRLMEAFVGGTPVMPAIQRCRSAEGEFSLDFLDVLKEPLEQVSVALCESVRRYQKGVTFAVDDLDFLEPYMVHKVSFTNNPERYNYSMLSSIRLNSGKGLDKFTIQLFKAGFFRRKTFVQFSYTTS